VIALTWPPEAYLWFKTLHIVGVVVWFAGLFYLVRLFIYHREAAELEPPLRQAFEDQYALMERRLANIITTPGMVVAVVCAVACQWSGRQLRALNELPTLLLVIVVMLVVFKNQFPTGAATWLIVALVVFMAASIQFYARWRRLRAESDAAAAAG
jgi:putative membrane protein